MSMLVASTSSTDRCLEPLVVSIPRQKSTTNRFNDRSLQIRSKRVRGWLLDLGQLPPVSAARRIHKALYAQNRLSLSVRNRLELAEPCIALVRTTVLDIQHHLRQESMPLTDRGQRHNRLARRLLTEMANSYKLVAMDDSLRKTRGNKAAPVNPRVLHALHRAIEFLSMVIVHSALVYEAYPKIVWRDLYRLYAHAEALNQTDYQASCVLSDAELSLNELFLRVVMFGASDPYSFNYGDSSALYTWLSSSGLSCTVTTRTGYTDKPGKFLVDLGVDAPPVTLTKVSRLSESTRQRVVDGKNVMQLALTVAETSRDDDLPAGLDSIDPQVLMQAVRGWQSPWSQERIDRNNTATEVVLCAGVKSAHFFMSQSLEFNPEQLFHEHDGHRASLESAGSFSTTQFKASRLNPNTANSHAMVICHAVNQTANGVRLRFHRSSGVQIRVRELLGLQDLQSLHWRVGVVRWIRAHDPDFVDVGMQCWGDTAAPVNLEIEGHQMLVPGLVLSDDSINRDLGLTTHDTSGGIQLLTQAGYFEPGARIRCLFSDGRARWFRLSELLESTDDVERFVVPLPAPTHTHNDPDSRDALVDSRGW